MTSPSADPVAAWLAGARWDIEHGSIRSAVELYAPRLLAAVEAALALARELEDEAHEPAPPGAEGIISDARAGVKNESAARLRAAISEALLEEGK